MRKLVIAVLVLTGAVATAQMKQAPKQQQPPPASRPGAQPLTVPGARNSSSTTFARISQEDAFKLFREGRVEFIDVRSNEQFGFGHIKGAHSIPRSQIVARLKEVLPGKTIITYCACPAEESAGAAAANLTAHGVKNVFALKGGYQQWKGSGRPIAVGPK